MKEIDVIWTIATSVRGLTQFLSRLSVRCGDAEDLLSETASDFDRTDRYDDISSNRKKEREKMGIMYARSVRDWNESKAHESRPICAHANVVRANEIVEI